jgi:adenine-specific DNA-methyltransferase
VIPTIVETAEAAKARGAFYTPHELTRFLANWAVRASGDRVLEPSCGDGAFVDAIVERFQQLGVVQPGDRLLGVEREPAEADRARSLAPGADIRSLDFFDLEPATTAKVDVAIGNPPYLRYHAFTGGERRKALARAQAEGVELTRLASSWAHFVVHASAFLKETGRLALVLPAELLHTDYGQPIREYLLRRFPSVVVVAFDQMVFPQAEVDAVLLLGSHDAKTGLQVVRVKDESALATLDLHAGASIANGQPRARWSSAIDPAAGQVYAEAIARNRAWRLGDLASVDIGFVTGANGFFMLSEGEARERDLPRDVLAAAVRRPRDVPGLEATAGELTWLLDLAGRESLDPATQRYLAEGVARGVPGGYKCRGRKPWYAVPIPKQRPEAFIPYMAHLGPRLITNGLGAKSTNLLHGVSFRAGAPPVRALSVAMCSSLTLLSAEIEGRAYGGGVLKMETREAESLRIPAINRQAADLLEDRFEEVDQLIRDRNVAKASELVDRILDVDHQAVWNAYLVFRSRRLGRRHTPARAKTPNPQSAEESRQ